MRPHPSANDEMVSFKEQVAADIKAIFLNADEFAEEHNLNGKTCLCNVQSPTEQEMFQQGETYDGFEATHGGLITVYVSREDFGELPSEGQTFKLDGEYCEVFQASDERGLLRIVLHRNHS